MAPVTLQALGLVVGGSYASGLKLYATVAVLGLLQHFELIHLPSSLSALGHPIVITIALALYVIEFFFDKIPYLGSVWNAFHTFIRPPAAALLSYSAFSSSIPEEWRVLAALLGAGIALSSHGAKTALKTTVETSPEPLSTIALSLSEDGVAAVLAWLSATHPVLTIVAVIGLLGVSAYLMVKFYRALRRGLKRVFSWSKTA